MLIHIGRNSRWHQQTLKSSKVAPYGFPILKIDQWDTKNLFANAQVGKLFLFAEISWMIYRQKKQTLKCSWTSCFFYSENKPVLLSYENRKIEWSPQFLDFDFTEIHLKPIQRIRYPHKLHLNVLNFIKNTSCLLSQTLE